MDIDNGEFITPSAQEDASTIAMNELLRQLEVANEVLEQTTRITHDTYHHARVGWRQCHHVTCRLVQDHLGAGKTNGEDNVPQSNAQTTEE